MHRSLILVALALAGCAHGGNAQMIDAATVSVWETTGHIASVEEAERLEGMGRAYWVPSIIDVRRGEARLGEELDRRGHQISECARPVNWDQAKRTLPRVYLGRLVGNRLLEIRIACPVEVSGPDRSRACWVASYDADRDVLLEVRDLDHAADCD